MIGPHPGRVLGSQEILEIAGYEEDWFASQEAQWVRDHPEPEYPFPIVPFPYNDIRERAIKWAAKSFVKAVHQEFYDGHLTKDRFCEWIETRIEGDLILFGSPGLEWMVEHPWEARHIVGDLGALCQQYPHDEFLVHALDSNRMFPFLSDASRPEIVRRAFRWFFSSNDCTERVKEYLQNHEIAELILQTLANSQPEAHSDFVQFFLNGYGRSYDEGHYFVGWSEMRFYVTFRDSCLWKFLSTDQMHEALRICAAKQPTAFAKAYRLLKAFGFPVGKLNAMMASLSVEDLMGSEMSIRDLPIEIQMELCRQWSPSERENSIRCRINTGDEYDWSLPSGDWQMTDMIYVVVEGLCNQSKHDQGSDFLDEMVKARKTTARLMTLRYCQRTHWDQIHSMVRDRLITLLANEHYVVGEVRIGHRISRGETKEQAEVWTDDLILIRDWNRTSYIPKQYDLVLACTQGRNLYRRDERNVVATTFELLYPGKTNQYRRR